MMIALLILISATGRGSIGIELSLSDSALSRTMNRNIHMWEMSDEEWEQAKQRGRAQSQRLQQLETAVFQGDVRTAQLRFAELVEATNVHGIPNEPLESSLLRLSNRGVAAMGDFYLDTGRLDDALLVLDVLNKKWHDTDNLFLAEIIALRTTSGTPQASDSAKGYLLSMNHQLANDFNTHFNRNNGLQHDLSLLYTARGQAARHSSELERAIYHYRRALEYDPENVFAQWYYAGALLDSGSIEAGKRILRELVGSEFTLVSKEAKRVLIRVGG